MRPVKVSQTGTGNKIVPVDYMQCPPRISAAGTITGTVTYNIEHTYDNVNDPSVTPIWFDPAANSGKTANYDVGYEFPIMGLRLNVTAGTGTVVMTVLQGDPR